MPNIGTLAAIAAALLFWATIGMVKLAAAMGAIGILGVRISGTTVLLTLILTLFFRSDASTLVTQIRPNLPLVCCAALMIGTAFFLFAWALLNGHGLSVAQAYLLIPFSLIFGGRIFFHERLRRIQWLGVCFAGMGVMHELLAYGALSWVTLVQTFAVTGYLLLHRVLHRKGCSSIQLLVAEFWLLFPAAIALLMIDLAKVVPFLASLSGVVVVMGLLLVTTLAYLSYIISNQHLSCAAFGMWGNLDPILILLSSVLFFNSQMRWSDLLTYVPMLVGTVLVVF